MADRHSQFIPSPRRVRVLFNKEVIADSKAMMLLAEPGRIPVYYFPKGDVRTDLLQPGNREAQGDRRGEAQFWHVRVGEAGAENSAYTFRNSPAGEPDLSGHVAFEWDRMEAWFEEDDEVYVHARDPYKRVDVLNSSRHIKVVIADTVVGETRRPRLLFETGLPTRYYILKADVRMALLEKSDTVTRCPYKGEAHYYSVRIGGELHRDLVWSYPYPILDCPKIEGLLCFFNEKVDIYEEDQLQPRPETPWS